LELVTFALLDFVMASDLLPRPLRDWARARETDTICVEDGPVMAGHLLS